MPIKEEKPIVFPINGVLHTIERNFCGDVDNHEAHMWGKKKVEGGTVRYRCSGLYWIPKG